MAEAFDVKKLATSPFTGLFWVKTIMFGLGLGCIFFIGYGVYTAYFKPKPLPQTQNITIEEGANVDIIQKQDAPKKKFIPFVEGFVEQKSGSDMETGIRAGLRFEF